MNVSTFRSNITKPREEKTKSGQAHCSLQGNSACCPSRIQISGFKHCTREARHCVWLNERWGRIFGEKATAAELVKKILCFYGNPTFITVL
jgi:hypothetical protein